MSIILKWNSKNWGGHDKRKVFIGFNCKKKIISASPSTANLLPSPIRCNQEWLQLSETCAFLAISWDQIALVDSISFLG
jgi:hypothetical protein